MGKSRQFSIEPGHPEPDNRSQYERFIELAKDLGGDQDEAALKEKLGVIARQKPKNDMTWPTRRRQTKA